MKFRNVKGTRDFFPDEAATRNWLIDRWRQVSRRSGFIEYDGPTFEYLELYTTKSGEGIVSDLYHFEDRGGRKLALRPEMTPTLARMVAAKAAALPRPIKWFSVPNFFRAEKPQRGRLREFWQWNVDIIGTTGRASNVADAECIFVAIDFFKEVGFSADQVEMRIGSRSLLGQVLEKLGIERGRHGALYAVLDKRDKLPEQEFIVQLEALGLSSAQNESLLKLGEARGDIGFGWVERTLGGAQQADSPFGVVQAVFRLLKAMNVSEYCVFDLSVVRGLAYYTGIVFEAFSKGTLGRAICGGGRYDNLLAEVGGPELSGVGYGLGDVIVVDQLEEMGLLERDQPAEGFFVVSEKPEAFEQTMAIVSLVRLGLKQPCDYSYRQTSVKKQMQEAAARNVRYVILAGKKFAIKEMQSGLQRELSCNTGLESEQARSSLLAELRQVLAGFGKGGSS